MIIKDTHLVPENIKAVRLSDYVRIAFPAIPSRKGASKAIKRGELWVNGTPAESGTWIEVGQKLDWMDLQQRAPKKYHLKLDVVFEDDYLAVINKPPGIEVSGNKFKTVENALSGSLSPSKQPDALPWPRPVHRLDYSTSGLLLVAKTSRALIDLGRAFEDRKIHKQYRTVVSGKLLSSGTITDPINGLPAQSEYEAVETVPSLRSGFLTELRLSPITGRTHQLRIHMASIGHPIVGDQKYGKEGNVLKGKGLFLAAVELSFPHPVILEKITVAIDTPAKFKSLLQREQARSEKFNATP
ncbi:MAG: RluA family pseudouridine synthase [Pontiella sp.]